MSLPHETDAIARIVREHGRSLLGFLLALVRDRELAEDLLQETFLRAWSARHKYEDRGQERAYLVRIAERLALDALRRPRLVRPVSEEVWQRIEPACDVESWPDEISERREAQRQLGEALDLLSDAQRRTLLLRYYGNLGFEEIARRMACPLGTVLSHCRRGLVALGRLLVEKS